jgi:hypothetical protein
VSNIPELNAWRDLRLEDIRRWTPRVQEALRPHCTTLGELADTPMRTLRRLPNMGMSGIREIRTVIAHAVAGVDVTVAADEPEQAAGISTVHLPPSCQTCRWWGHDDTGAWVISPKAGAVNVCGVHRQSAGERRRCNVITTAQDWCAEHLPLPIEAAEQAE